MDSLQASLPHSTDRLAELFPYLDFLRDTYNQDFKEFKKQFEEPNAVRSNGTQVVLAVEWWTDEENRTISR
jgi:hypothetical protein